MLLLTSIVSDIFIRATLRTTASKDLTRGVRSILHGTCSYPTATTARRSGPEYSRSLKQSPIALTLPGYGCRRFTDQFSASLPLSPYGLTNLNSMAHSPAISKSGVRRVAARPWYLGRRFKRPAISFTSCGSPYGPTPRWNCLNGSSEASISLIASAISQATVLRSRLGMAIIGETNTSR